MAFSPQVSQYPTVQSLHLIGHVFHPPLATAGFNTPIVGILQYITHRTHQVTRMRCIWGFVFSSSTSSDLICGSTELGPKHAKQTYIIRY